MTLPNILTCIRVLLIPVFMALAYQEGDGFQTAALAVYVIACLTDYVDGKLARKNNQVTNFGKFMDPVADKLLVMAALVVLVDSGRMPSWVCIVMLAREFIISGFRLVAAGGGKVIAAGMLGKLKTVFQMSSTVALMLLVPVAGAPLLGHFGVVLANVLMYIAVALTIVSGAEYIIKNIDCISDM